MILQTNDPHSHRAQSAVVATSPGIAVAEGVVGGPLIGAVVGAIGYSLGYDNGGTLGAVAGGLVGGVLGLAFGLLAALTVIGASHLCPTTDRSTAVRRDRIAGGLVLLAAGAAAALAWGSLIDLEEGRRLREVVLLGLAPASAAIVWSMAVGLPHLRSASA